jgi:predicted ATPase
LFALDFVTWLHIWRGDYAAANPLLDEAIALAEEKGALLWKGAAILYQGWLLASTGKAPSAVQTITAGIAAWRSTGSTLWIPFYLPHLAGAHAELGLFDDAWRCIDEATTAVETTNERWCEAKSAIAACDFLRLRAAMTTVAPADASPRAMPSPMPPLPPVTTATFPLKSNNFVLRVSSR